MHSHSAPLFNWTEPHSMVVLWARRLARSVLSEVIFIREYLETINQEQMSFGVNLDSFSAIILLSPSYWDPQIERNGNQKEVKWLEHDYQGQCFLFCRTRYFPGLFLNIGLNGYFFKTTERQIYIELLFALCSSVNSAANHLSRSLHLQNKCFDKDINIHVWSRPARLTAVMARVVIYILRVI